MITAGKQAMYNRKMLKIVVKGHDEPAMLEDVIRYVTLHSLN